MRNLLFILILAAAMSSCCTSRHIATSSKDSVRVEIRTRTEYFRDTIIREIPAISEAITTRDTVSHLENFYAQSDARINPDGTLFHTLSTKPQKEPIPIDKPIQYRDSIVYQDKVVKEVVEVERNLSWWEKTQMKGFWVLVIIIAFVYRKMIMSLIRRFI